MPGWAKWMSVITGATLLVWFVVMAYRGAGERRRRIRGGVSLAVADEAGQWVWENMRRFWIGGFIMTLGGLAPPYTGISSVGSAVIRSVAVCAAFSVPMLIGLHLAARDLGLKDTPREQM